MLVKSWRGQPSCGTLTEGLAKCGLNETSPHAFLHCLHDTPKLLKAYLFNSIIKQSKKTNKQNKNKKQTKNKDKQKKLKQTATTKNTKTKTSKKQQQINRQSHLNKIQCFYLISLFLHFVTLFLFAYIYYVPGICCMKKK